MATYYVRPDGNNTNAGTGPLAAQAWATLTKAAQTAVAGDTVHVAPGKYFESVNPTNSGTSASVLITFIGDVGAKIFTGVAKGAVIISTRPSATPYINPSRTSAIVLTSKNYIKFVDFVFERGMSGQSIEGIGNGCIFVRCVVEGFLYLVSTVTVLSEFYECTIKANTAHHIGKVKFVRCFVNGYFTGTQMAMEVWFLHCNLHIQGTCRFENAGAVSGNINFFGSNIILYEKGDSVGSVINSSQGTLIYSFYGCHVKGLSRLLRSASPSSEAVQVYGCLFENLEATFDIVQNATFTYYYNHSIGVMSGTIVASARSIYVSAFEDCFQLSPNTNLTMSTCFIDRYVNLNGALTSPSYGPIPETRKMGVFETVTDKIGEDEKSLKFKGSTYTPVQVFWIPCEENEPVTLIFKAKRSNTGASYLPTFNFGDQEVVMADNTNVQDITLTYTHHKKELVPFYVCGRVGVSGTDFLIMSAVEISS